MLSSLILTTAPTVEPLTLAEAKTQLRLESSFTDDDALVTAMCEAVRQYAETICRRSLVAQTWTLLLDQFPRPAFNVGSANWYGPQWGINPGPLTVLSPDGSTGYEIYLPNPPLLAVQSIGYVDTTSPLGVQQTLDPSQYLVTPGDKGCITPAFGTVWPQTQQQKGAVQVTFSAGYAAPFTASTSGNTITPLGWPTLQVGSVVRLSNAGGALPTPLKPKTDYYIASASMGVYTLSATSGGAAITLTDVGTGTNFIGAVPEGIKAWMKLRIGSMYENREEATVLTRATLEVMPFMPNLLDPFRIWEFPV